MLLAVLKQLGDVWGAAVCAGRALPALAGEAGPGRYAERASTHHVCLCFCISRTFNAIKCSFLFMNYVAYISHTLVKHMNFNQPFLASATGFGATLPSTSSISIH